MSSGSFTGIRNGLKIEMRTSRRHRQATVAGTAMRRIRTKRLWRAALANFAASAGVVGGIMGRIHLGS